jgi:hypothetical protein
MFTRIIILAIMVILYGLAWHNQPAKDGETHPRSRFRSES